MWECPKCGREFKNTNQDHYCVKVSEVDEYICAQSPEVQPLLQSVRETIRAAAPDAIEKISYQMPTFWQGENLVHFAAFKNHIGLYPGGEAVGVFANRLTGYKTSKGAIQFPLDKPIDHELIADIVRWRLEQAKGKQDGRS
ncbi:MAG: iron chaperone [Coriobacteriia bacterium]